MAGEARADFDHVFADFVSGVVHAVERCDAFDFGIGSVEAVCDFGDSVAAEETVIFSLGDPESGEDACLVFGIVGFERFELIDGGLRELQFEFFWSGCFRSLVNGSELDQVAHWY
jgi:hypothetical protein